MDHPIAALLDHISATSFIDEQQSITSLLPLVASYSSHMDEINSRAERYIDTIRSEGLQGGVETFIHQFGLQEREAVGLLCLAEALLRIPDADTADALIFDKLHGANWTKFLDEHSGFSLHARAWGLMLSTKLTNMQDSETLIGQVMHRLSEPAIRQALKAAMHLLGKEFVAGKTIAEALHNTESELSKGYLFSFDMLGEGARTDAQALHYLQHYLDALDVIHALDDGKTKEKLYSRHSISVKLSALYPRYEYRHQAGIDTVLYERIKLICVRAKKYHIAVSIDSEEADRLDSELVLFSRLIGDAELRDYDGLGFVLQAYQKRALPVIDLLETLAKRHNKQIPVRLVKGAYWDNEIKWAQMEGLPSYPVYTHKHHTDVSFLACAVRLLEGGTLFFPQFATHNALSAAAIITLAEKRGLQEAYEFQRLYGMGDAFYDQMIAKRPCRIYAPVGAFEDLLPYLIRRLMENGANSNFVNQLMDETLDMQILLRNPIQETMDSTAQTLPLPSAIFDDRQNSSGYSLGSREHHLLLQSMKEPFLNISYHIQPLINGVRSISGTSCEIVSPAHHHDVLGQVVLADEATLRDAVRAASQSAPAWKAHTIEYRAKMLDKVADLLKDHEGECYALLAREAGKVIEDAIAELREAIDFCRYYAAQARDLAAPIHCQSYTGEDNILQYQGKGVVACISPWNFPLAIFTGQIAAALVAGNSVIAKPAEETSIIADLVIRLFYEAGVPQDVLHYTPAQGMLFGEVVLSSPMIAGVAFTGSTHTARLINRILAARDAPIARFIAETGGQNCMIVDSSALLEQATDDILASAFGSAGQRCSALRVLFIQDSIYDALIDMLQGAMAERVVGNPQDIMSDIGPIISRQAKTALEAHLAQMEQGGHVLYATPLPPECADGYYVAPHLCEIPSMEILEEEHFGPVLHVIRYAMDDIEEVIAQINSSGYGLTFGIHSRIQERMQWIASKIDAGNIYMNRNMTGAVVGVQPFGGMALSGTGPKAGGPDYVKAFMDEKVVTHNNTAIGGNVALLGERKTLK